MTIQVSHLKKSFGAFTAVKDVSFQVKAGEIFGLLGPNGAGKSTIIKMLCGIIAPTAGDATIEGYDIVSDTEKIKQMLGYMSQRFSLYDDLTVEENINFYSGIYLVPAEKKQERKEFVLKISKLEGHLNTLTGTLPTGLKQRLALGCAIIHEPKILFLDEPTAGVDPINRRHFWDLIYQLAEQKIAIIVSTHYMDEAEYFDEIALIYRGELIAKNTPDGLKEQTGTHSLEDVFVNLIEEYDQIYPPQQEVLR